MEATGYRLIADEGELREAAARVSAAEYVGLDVETTALSPLDGRLRLLQLATPGGTFVVDLFGVGSLEPLRGVLEGGPVKVAHNSKFEYSFLKHECGIAVSPIFDTMLTSQLIAGGERGLSHSLEEVVRRYLGRELDKTVRAEDWSGDLSRRQLEYAARDAAVLLPLHGKLRRVLREEKLEYVARIEFAAVPSLAEMELAGIRLDRRRWRELERVVRERRDRVARELEAQLPQPEGVLPLEGLGPGINLNSPGQVIEAFRALGLDLPDTREWTLMRVDHPAAKLLLEYRELQKKLGTYLETYPDYIHPGTGRIHASFAQCRVPTGRLACSHPNIQQIPHEDEFRSCFVAGEGYLFVIADYSQIELRILAEVSGDEGFVRAFRQGEDLHRVTAATMFGVPMEEVTGEQRSAAKRINFGLAYGRGAQSLSAQLGTDEERARELIDEYFASYPKVQRYLQGAAEKALRQRTLRTLSGRVRKFGDTSGLDRKARSALRREAMNFPIQGSSADIAKLAMIHMRRELEGLDARLVNSIHDEFVVECREEIAGEVAERVRRSMLRAGETLLRRVPVEVEVAISPEWRK
ncbi:bifunctional 3'-5' exonuclease/DNA polymerase [Rubrobacter taiwanensis]|jgi:DNA polymerase-1|uniref:DNA polymerase I n=1 Tax=Rubrobacter taiwanensis TaxID=185139 RepID=A0A4R1BS87_9ACTN|nr:bifunctional 3'-5' exonuclease/DNA polymerase [Rubrobacter taiwanensis]TCJ20654.1 bifunctional 3'-5' exonuclease/DNA polymerase [Rubrobacter taiwanensis]